VKSFGEWFGQQGRAAAPAAIPDEDELPEGLYMRDGAVMATCRRCERDYEWPAEIEKFPGESDYYNLCGGSESCIP
jgi:hypothetical protein